MIRSITFNGEFGYITEKIPEPISPIRGIVINPRKLSDKEKEQYKQYKKDYKEWEKHKDDYNNPILAKTFLIEHFILNLIKLI